jgi:outer membrane lipoprotein carrier protein
MLLLLGLPWGWAYALSPAQQLAKVLGQYHTYQADFTQYRLDAQGHKLGASVSAGRFVMQRPDRLRWEIQSPMAQVILLKAGQVSVYDVALQQITRQPIQGVAGPLDFLLRGNAQQLVANYRVHLTSVPSTRTDTYQLEKQQGQSERPITVRMVKGRLTQVSFTNDLDQPIAFFFTGIHINQSVDQALFTLKPPAGVTVIAAEAPNLLA